MVCCEERVESDRIKLDRQPVMEADPVDVRVKVDMGLWCQIKGLQTQRTGHVAMSE